MELALALDQEPLPDGTALCPACRGWVRPTLFSADGSAETFQKDLDNFYRNGLARLALAKGQRNPLGGGPCGHCGESLRTVLGRSVSIQFEGSELVEIRIEAAAVPR